MCDLWGTSRLSTAVMLNRQLPANFGRVQLPAQYRTSIPQDFRYSAFKC